MKIFLIISAVLFSCLPTFCFGSGNPFLLPGMQDILMDNILPRLEQQDLGALAQTDRYLEAEVARRRVHRLTSIDFSQASNLSEEAIIAGLNGHLGYDAEQRPIQNVNITAIDLSHQTITKKILEFIAKYFPNLNILRLSNIKGNIQEIIHGLKILKALRRLDLSENGIKDAEAKIIALLTDLTHLNLSWNEIEDTGAAALAATLTNLTYLNLAMNNIGTGAEALAVLTNLRHLNLSWNYIEDSEAQVLAEALINLRYLNLSHCSIENEGAEAVAAIPELESLDLSENNIDATVQEQITEQFAKIKIKF